MKYPYVEEYTLYSDGFCNFCKKEVVEGQDIQILVIDEVEGLWFCSEACIKEYVKKNKIMTIIRNWFGDEVYNPFSTWLRLIKIGGYGLCLLQILSGCIWIFSQQALFSGIFLLDLYLLTSFMLLFGVTVFMVNLERWL